MKNLRQEVCGPNKSSHYTSELFSFFIDKKDIKHIRVMTDNNRGDLAPICGMILLSTYGSGQQNNKYEFQLPTSQDLKML